MRLVACLVACLTACLWGLFFTPAVWACAVCQDPESASNDVFGLSTAFLTFLPLIAMASVGLWMWRRLKLLEAEQMAQNLTLSQD
jgi:hypothetical protein